MRQEVLSQSSQLDFSFASLTYLQRFPNHSTGSITSIDFDDTGELCLIAQDDGTLQIYNTKEGKHAKELKSQKYGVDLARFTHHSQSIIYASTKIDGESTSFSLNHKLLLSPTSPKILITPPQTQSATSPPTTTPSSATSKGTPAPSPASP